MLNRLRPTLRPGERVIWKREPVKDSVVRKRTLGIDNRIWGLTPVMCLWVYIGITDGWLWALSMLAGLLLFYGLLGLFGLFGRGHRVPQVLTNSRILLPPLYAVPLSDLVSVQPMGDYVKLETAKRYFYLGPVQNPCEVTNLIEGTRANA